jgi:hypothetical protein
MRLLFLFSCLHLSFLLLAQTEKASKKDSTNAAIAFVTAWEKDFLDIGISLQKDSLHINEETKKLLLDSQYRKSTYPAKYNWPQAIALMNKMDLKKAFWHIINLYRTDTAHRELALQTFVLYDSLVDMEKILTNSFYTYSKMDPQVCVVKNGKPDIQHPDIWESKLGTLKEIIEIIKLNRKPVAKK